MNEADPMMDALVRWEASRAQGKDLAPGWLIANHRNMSRQFDGSLDSFGASTGKERNVESARSQLSQPGCQVSTT